MVRSYVKYYFLLMAIVIIEIKLRSKSSEYYSQINNELKEEEHIKNWIHLVYNREKAMPPKVVKLLLQLKGKISNLDNQTKSDFPVYRKNNYYLKTPHPQSQGISCYHQPPLSSSLAELMGRQQIVFLETSGRDWLLPRQACAVESAARSGRLPVKVFIMNSHLNLNDNVTCSLYTAGLDITFHSINLHTIFSGTPLSKTYTLYGKSKHSVTHYSDALRLALIWKIGGFYLDTDMVVIRPLNDMSNVIGYTHARSGLYYAITKAGLQRVSRKTRGRIPNSVFHFSRLHPLLWSVMSTVAKVTESQFEQQDSHEQKDSHARAEIGPRLLTKEVLRRKGVKKLNKVVSDSDLRILPSKTFFPAEYFQVKSLWPKKKMSSQMWEDEFRNSVMVHFFSSQSCEWEVTRTPEHEAYAYLGPTYCPISYWGDPDF